MADKNNFYYDQEVTEQELDGAFDSMEQADWDQFKDLGLKGIRTGAFHAAPTSPQSFNVRISGNNTPYDPNDPPGVGVSKLGKRLYAAAAASVSVQTDENGDPINLPSPGNEKWVSIFVTHARLGSDPRTDGNQQPVDFVQTETVSYRVVAGAEDAIGAAVKPSLHSDDLLVADIQLTNGLASIGSAQVSLDRTEYWRKSGGASTELGELYLQDLYLQDEDGFDAGPANAARGALIPKALAICTNNGLFKSGHQIARVTRLSVGRYEIETYEQLFTAEDTIGVIHSANRFSGIVGQTFESTRSISNGAITLGIYTRDIISNVYVDCPFTVAIFAKGGV